MIRSVICLALALLILSSCVTASGFQTPGIGGRARGMGGAFRAIANDWTAAYYNPAGLAFVADNQMGFSQGFFHPRDELTPNYRLIGATDTYDFGVFNNELLYNDHEILSMPSAGFALRLPLFGETVWGLSAYQPFDNNLTWAVYRPLAAFNDNIAQYMPPDQIKSDIDVVAFQLSVAREFSEDRLSVGLGFQVLRADMWIKDFIVRSNPVWTDRPKDIVTEFTSNDGHGWAFGLKFGMMNKVNEQMNLALTADIPSEITVDGTSNMQYAMPKANFGDTSLFLGGATSSLVTVDADFETKLKLPTSFGFGLSYQVNDKLLTSLDAGMTLWSKFEGYEFAYSNYDLSAVRRVDPDSSYDYFFTGATQDYTMTWEDAVTVAMGLQYAHSEFLTLVGGFSYDQSPLRNTVEFTPKFVETGTRYGFNTGLIVSTEQWEVGLIGSYFQYPDERVVTDAVDTNNDGLSDSFPGTYKASSFETILSVNYRF